MIAVLILCDKIHFKAIYLSHIHIIGSAKQFQINDIFQYMACIHSLFTQKHISKTNIYHIVFIQGLKVLFPFDIKAFSLINDVRFLQSRKIFFYRFRINLPTVGSHGIRYFLGGEGIPDIVKNKLQNTLKHHGIRHLFPIHDIFNYYRIVDTFQVISDDIGFGIQC